MPDEEREVRLVAKTPARGEPPIGLRIMKSIRTPRDDTYLVLMPGVMPAGLHLSFHPSGEFHLKSRDLGTVARVNFVEVVRALRSGSLDEALASIVTPPKGGRSAKGFIVRPDQVPELAPGRGKGDVEIPVATMLEAMEAIEMDDTLDLPAHLEWLRKEGKLPERGMLFLDLDGSKLPTIFINLVGDKPFPAGLETAELPPEMPMRLTIAAAFRQFPRFGGMFFSLPAGEGMRDLAHRAGLGTIYDELAKSLDGLGGPSFEEGMKTWTRDLGVAAGEAIVAMLEGGPLHLPQPRTPPKATDDGPSSA